MIGPEVTFTVRPRPNSDDPRLIVDAVPAAIAAATERTIELVEERRERVSIVGELALLVRYAFGRF